MTQTGTCLDNLLPTGLPPKATVLLLAAGPEVSARPRHQAHEDLLAFIEVLKNQLAATCLVRLPDDGSWPEDEDKPRIFIGSLKDSLARATTVLRSPDPEVRVKPCATWLDQAIFLGCSRVLYGLDRDVVGTHLYTTAGVVILAHRVRGQTMLKVDRHDFDPKALGSSTPLTLVTIEGPTAPPSVWDLIADDEDDF